MELNRRRPLLVLLKGHPCCGKSTLAQKLCCFLPCALIDKDDAKSVLCDTLGGVADESRLNDVSYSILFRSVQTQLEAGLDCIVDSPLARRTHYERLVQICHKVGRH